jgi:hypothetical protein
MFENRIDTDFKSLYNMINFILIDREAKLLEANKTSIKQKDIDITQLR